MSDAVPPHGEKKDHHFVPQMYLRAFADPSSLQGEVWRYGPGFKPQRKAPKGIAWQDYFYDAAGELPPEDNDVEEWFGEIETIAAPHLQKLRDGNVNLSDQERAELATFISLLLTRTRSYRELVNRTASSVFALTAKEMVETPGAIEGFIEQRVRSGAREFGVQEVRDGLRAIIDGRAVVEQRSKAWTIKQIFERSEAYDNLFSEMHWNLLKTPAGDAFITSDDPVIVSDPLGQLQGPKGYRPSRLTQMQFPVSPRYLLVGEFNVQPGRVVPITATLVASFRTNQIRHAHREVYASFQSDELQATVETIFRDRPPRVPELSLDSFKG